MEESKVNIVQSEKVGAIPTIYCNQVRIIMSQWDMTIDVGQASFAEMIALKGTPADLPVEIKARIIMSPQHAKAFTQALLQNVQNYEKDFGEIAIQPKQQKQP